LELFLYPPQSCNMQPQDSLKVRHTTKLQGSINAIKLVNDLAKVRLARKPVDSKGVLDLVLRWPKLSRTCLR
jgi:hypothetical protein